MYEPELPCHLAPARMHAEGQDRLRPRAAPPDEASRSRCDQVCATGPNDRNAAGAPQPADADRPDGSVVVQGERHHGCPAPG
ncbi:hypothetical protein SDC9_184151 [bioreactor metagenome]|uniref:Uncharacterized protein n=1 Tax=bioreactor metagenome TaxID=1076179 RepID=A0A645HC79_9ZZZZ